MTTPAERLATRAAAVRSRAAVQRWQMRQLDHAAGCWYRLARLLALSRRAWAIDEAAVSSLLALGYAPEPVGLELEPPRRLFVVPEEEALALAGAEEIPLQASPELLGHRDLALAPFD